MVYTKDDTEGLELYANEWIHSSLLTVTRSDFPTTAWGNFCTSFQTKGTSVLLTSHCGEQFVTFHKNYLKRHQQLFPRRLLGGYVPAKQLEAQET